MSKNIKIKYILFQIDFYDFVKIKKRLCYVNIISSQM